MLYDTEKNRKATANRATLAVARKKQWCYLMAVDRRQRDFQVLETSSGIGRKAQR